MRSLVKVSDVNVLKITELCLRETCVRRIYIVGEQIATVHERMLVYPLADTDLACSC